MEWREITGSVMEQSIRIHRKLDSGYWNQFIRPCVLQCRYSSPRLRVNRFQHVPASL